MAVAEPLPVTAVAPPAVQRPAIPASIVPLKGLPIVGAVLVFIVLSIAGNWTWALTFLHVAGGGGWTGVDLFMGFVIGPTLRRLSIPARIEITSRLLPKVLLILPTLATMTLASGLQPANLAVLFELRKPQPNPVIIGSLMKRFVYAAGVIGAMQILTLIIMTRL